MYQAGITKDWCMKKAWVLALGMFISASWMEICTFRERKTERNAVPHDRMRRSSLQRNFVKTVNENEGFIFCQMFLFSCFCDNILTVAPDSL